VWKLDVVSRFRKWRWLEPAFDWTSQKEPDQSLISSLRLARKPVLAPLYALDLELLAGLDAVLLADFGGQNNLPFA